LTLTAATAALGGGLPATPKPVSLTVAHTSTSLTVRVHVRHLTHANAGLVGLDVFTHSPSAHYAVHQNGPGLPYTVNPIPGHPAGQSTGVAVVSFGHGTVTFKFALAAIGNPHQVRLRAFAGSLAPGARTRFYTINL
jgi:hypothetical protein